MVDNFYQDFVSYCPCEQVTMTGLILAHELVSPRTLITRWPPYPRKTGNGQLAKRSPVRKKNENTKKRKAKTKRNKTNKKSTSTHSHTHAQGTKNRMEWEKEDKRDIHKRHVSP